MSGTESTALRCAYVGVCLWSRGWPPSARTAVVIEQKAFSFSHSSTTVACVFIAFGSGTSSNAVMPSVSVTPASAVSFHSFAGVIGLSNTAPSSTPGSVKSVRRIGTSWVVGSPITQSTEYTSPGSRFHALCTHHELVTSEWQT